MIVEHFGVRKINEPGSYRWSVNFLDKLERVMQLKQLHYSQKLTFVRYAVYLSLTDFRPLGPRSFGEGVPLGSLLDISTGEGDK